VKTSTGGRLSDDRTGRRRRHRIEVSRREPQIATAGEHIDRARMTTPPLLPGMSIAGRSLMPFTSSPPDEKESSG
jgi:hypothetical protein